MLRWAKAKIKEEIKIPNVIPKSLDKIGNNVPLNIISSKSGAKTVVVMNKRKKAK